MQPINVVNKSTSPNARTKRQTTLGSFLLKNDSNLIPLAKATFKRHVRNELAEEVEQADRKKQKAMRNFNRKYAIENSHITREGRSTAVKRAQ